MNSINERNQMSPITKAHKRILNGPEDSVKSFCNVAFLVADGKFPTNKVHRAVDVELASGQNFANVLYREIGDFIRTVADGEEDFLILINLPNGDFRTYSFIDAGKQELTERIQLVKPFGRYTPTGREVLSLEQLNMMNEKRIFHLLRIAVMGNSFFIIALFFQSAVINP